MINKKGTPKSMNEAILNALVSVTTEDIQSDVIRVHVKDFLAQKFGAAMLTDQSGEIQKLWFKIFPEDKN